MNGLLIGLGIGLALVVGIALAITRVDHIFISRRLENLEARMLRFERSRGSADLSSPAPAHDRRGARAHVRTSAHEEEST